MPYNCLNDIAILVFFLGFFKQTLNSLKFLIVQCYLSILRFVNAVPLYPGVANSPAWDKSGI